MKRSLLVLLLLPLGASAWGLDDVAADWASRVHISGDGAVRVMDGQARAELDHNGGLMVYQAGLAADVDLSAKLSFWYDLDLIRDGVYMGSTFDPLEQIYLRYEGLFGFAPLNLTAGRFFTPFGEDYLRWKEADNPFNSPSVAFPWALDEGVLLSGDLAPGGRLYYAAALQNGNAGLNFPENSSKAVALKLGGRPLPWLQASASYMNTGTRGTSSSSGMAELWISGVHIMPLGTNSGGYGASPGKTVSAGAFEADLRAKLPAAEAGLTYGRIVTDDSGEDFNRTLQYAAAELIAKIPGTGDQAYAAARYSVIGTFSSNDGYHFAGTEMAFNGLGNNSDPYAGFNYDMRELHRTSLAAGWRFDPRTVLKAEYSWEGASLINAAKTPANLALLGRRDFWSVELAFRF